MISLLFCLATNLPAYAEKTELKIDRPVAISKDHKFTVLRNGAISHESVDQLESNSPYCAIENYKLNKMTLKEKSALKASVERVELPNPEIQRFNVAAGQGYSIFCDFTGNPNFDEFNVRDEINDQLIGWAHLE